MRGADLTQEELYGHRTREDRIPPDHPLRTPRAVVNMPLKTKDGELDAHYARRAGSPFRPSVRCGRA